MAAADTGDILFPGTPFHPKEYFTLRAAEITVFLPVFYALHKLRNLCFQSGRKGQVFPVFLHSLRPVPGEHTKQGENIQQHAEKAQDPQTCEAACQGQYQAG